MGQSWEHSNNGLINHNVLALCVNGSELFAGTTSGVYFSMNEGADWSFLSSKAPTDSVVVVSLAANDSYLFAGTGHGIMRYPLAQLKM